MQCPIEALIKVLSLPILYQPRDLLSPKARSLAIGLFKVTALGDLLLERLL